LAIKIRDIRQNKSEDRIVNLNSIWDCPDCGFYQIQTQRLQPGQSYEVLKPRLGTKAASSINYNQCPNPECGSKNMAAVVTEEDAKDELPLLPMEKKQGKYRLIHLEEKPIPDGCQCPPFTKEMELKAASKGEKYRDWEPTLPIQICSQCDKEYHLDWTVPERTYF